MRNRCRGNSHICTYCHLAKEGYGCRRICRRRRTNWKWKHLAQDTQADSAYFFTTQLYKAVVIVGAV
jgi:hypothetical protein